MSECEMRLFAVQFHDQLFLDVFRDAFSFRKCDEGSFHFCFVPVEPVDLIVFSTGSTSDSGITLGSSFKTDLVSWFELI